jgi:hypothetical protein
MLSGVVLAMSDIPLELIDRHGLRRRVHDRGGEHELQFHFADAERLLPVRRDGRLEFLRWRNRRGESSSLPCTAWTQVETVEKGGWGEGGVEPVVIPASMGLDKGVWFGISQGIRALLSLDERGVPLTENHFFSQSIRVMARSRLVFGWPSHHP